MADDVTISNGDGTDFDVATDDDGSGNQVQIVKLAQSADGSRTAISADSDGMLVNLGANNDVTVSGTVAVTDNSGSLTVDNAALSTTGGGTETGALRVTLANNSTGVVSVDDNGASLTVDVGTALPAGTNNIGDVDVASIAAGDNNIGNVDIASALPAGTNNIGDVDIASMPASDQTTDSNSTALQTNAIMNDLTVLTPKFKSVAIAASSTDSSVIAAVTSKKLRILAGTIQCGATATSLTLESDDASADTTVFKLTMGANGGAHLAFCPVGHFETDAGEALIATTDAGSTVQINLTYVEV